MFTKFIVLLLFVNTSLLADEIGVPSLSSSQSSLHSSNSNLEAQSQTASTGTEHSVSNLSLNKAEQASSNQIHNLVIIVITIALLLLSAYVYAINRALKGTVKQQMKSETKLKESETRYRLLFEDNPSAAIVWQRGGIIADWNKSAETLFGWTRQEVVGKCFIDLMICESDRKRWQHIVEVVFDIQVLPRSQNQNMTSFGDTITCEWVNTMLPKRDKKPAEILSLATDVTDRLKLEQEVRQMAYIDELTQLPNRRLFQDRFEQAMLASDRNKNFGAILYIDIDNFKPLNDTYGHATGDLLLTEVASRLKASIRASDTAARVGGDEFIVLLNKLSNDKVDSLYQADQVAEKIITVLSEPYKLNLVENNENDKLLNYLCSASLGIALFQGTEFSQQEVIRIADKAMYQQKNRKKYA